MQQISNERLQIEIDILLKEYEALREEAVQRLHFFFQVYQIYIAGLGLVYSYSISNNQFDIFLIFPWLSLALYMRLLWDQKVGVSISEYANKEIEAKITLLLGQPLYNSDILITKSRLGWDEYFPIAFKKFPPLYKHSIFIIFGLISIMPSTMLSGYNIIAFFMKKEIFSKITNFSILPISIISFFTSIIIFLWIYKMTYRQKY